MIWFGAMYWNPAIPPIAAVSIEILKQKEDNYKIWMCAMSEVM